MTALKPLENRRVFAVASEKYPLNKVCAHPDCTEPALDPHHCFPRSMVGGDSWFVQITEDDGRYVVIPHVAGLCRVHHDDVEEHRAWIKLEDDEWLWLDRVEAEVPTTHETYEGDTFETLGPLNPQPGSVEGKTKRKRFKGEARRKRRVISLRVPDDSEDGAALLDEALELVKERLVRDGLYQEGDLIPNYEAVMAALHGYLSSKEDGEG